MRARIGIIGFGVVGKSVLRFLATNLQHNISVFAADDYELKVWDARELNPQEQELIAQHNATFVSQSQSTLAQFFDENDYLIASPGIDLRSCQYSLSKLITEMDLFYSLWHKPVIGITGTLGKTTVTRMISSLLSIKERVAMGGNIGTAMLDLLAEQPKKDVAVLELSSFQLAYARAAASPITVWTNLYPNHLDWHGTMSHYFISKANLLALQDEQGNHIISVDLLNNNRDRLDELKKVMKGHIYIVGDCDLHEMHEWLDIFPAATLMYVDDGWVCNNKGRLFPLALLPTGNFTINWLLSLAALYVHTGNLSWLSTILTKKPEVQEHIRNEINQIHRLEHFLTANGIDFYNDSKSTVTQATQAAIEVLAKKNRPIIVILGGTSKGVDRRQFFDDVARHPGVKKVLYLGPESIKLGLNPSYASLDELINAIVCTAQPGDQVLFSPSGASFDLFANYNDRGEKFKQAIMRKFS